MSLHQISKRTGSINRVPIGQTPVVELHLEPHERLVSLDLRESMFVSPERVTTDWYWTAIIDSDLGV